MKRYRRPMTISQISNLFPQTIYLNTIGLPACCLLAMYVLPQNNYSKKTSNNFFRKFVVPMEKPFKVKTQTLQKTVKIE